MKKIFLFIAFYAASISAQTPALCTDSLGVPITVILTPTTLPLCPEGLGGSLGAQFSTTTGESFCYCNNSGCVFYWTNDEGYASGPTLHSIYNVGVGNYHMMVQHPSGCIAEGDAVLSSSIPPFFNSLVKSDATCATTANGTAEVIVEPLSGQFHFLWDTGDTTQAVTNLAPGEHDVLITNYAGCTYLEVFIIASPEPIQTEIQTQDACAGENNGSLHLSITGGIPPYACYLNGALQSEIDSIGNLAPGLYEVSIMDSNGCERIENIELFAIPVQVSIYAPSTTICQGETISLIALGGIHFLWSGSSEILNVTDSIVTVMPQVSTTYYCNIINGLDCAATASFTVEVSDIAIPLIQVVDTQVCAGGFVNVQASVPGNGITYSWLPTTGVSNPNSNATSITPASTQTYILTATNSDGCQSSATLSLTVIVCSGIADLNGQEIHLLPNPVSQFFSITGLKKEAEIHIYSLSSQLVFSAKVLPPENALDLSTLSPGIYMAEILQGESKANIKIVKE